jgi:hypothetical protein
MKYLLLIAVLLCGCAPQSVQGTDGREYVRVDIVKNAPQGIPGSEAIYQLKGEVGAGKPAYIRSIAIKNHFVRVGTLQ